MIRSLWQPVAIAEDIWAQLAELNRGTGSLHPAFVTNVLGDEGGPYRDRFERPSTSGGLESYAFRVLIFQDLEFMQVPTIGDLTAWVQLEFK
jgi:hypothetical protein